MTDTLTFNLDGFHNRTVSGWFFAGMQSPRSCGAQTAAQRHARRYGNAGMWRADDSFVLFYREGDRIRQKTWRRAVPKTAA